MFAGKLVSGMFFLIGTWLVSSIRYVKLVSIKGKGGLYVSLTLTFWPGGARDFQNS